MLAGIFVGGRARRMQGTAKGLLRLPDGESLIERLRARLLPVASRVVLVGAHPAYASAGLPVIADEGEALGPLGGLIALLREAGDGPVLAVACDMPAVTDALVARLVGYPPGSAAVAPHLDGRWQPFFARYHAPAALVVAERHAAAGILSLQRLLDALKAAALPVSAQERALLDDCDDWPAASLRGLRPPSVCLQGSPGLQPSTGEATTMQPTTIAHLLAGKVPAGTTVTVRGWVRTRRDSKAGLSFIHLHDGSCFDPLQIVAPRDLPNYDSEVTKLTAGCAVVASGAVVPSQGKGQAFELQASEVRVLGWVDDPETYPIQQKKHTYEYLREVAHLRPRTNTLGALTRVRHCLSMAIHRYFHENGFFWVHTPIVSATDAEGAGAAFRVSTLDLANPDKIPRTPEGRVDFAQDFFGKETFLTVSGQLNVEAYCLAMSRVYTFGPTFRAENSNTSRHLAEFWMIEPEIAFADLAADADLAESFLKYIFKALLDERGDDMKFFVERVDKECVARVEAFVTSSFERMDYTDAVRALEKSGKSFEFPVRWGMDLQSEHERWLTEEHVKRPVVVMNYPKEIKAFYMRLNDDDKTVAAMDVLAPGIGEIIGGSQREERLDVLDRRLAELKLDPEVYWWYRDLRRYGTVPHAGFGLGLERTIIYATGMANIRDVIPFPRAPGQAAF